MATLYDQWKESNPTAAATTSGNPFQNWQASRNLVSVNLDPATQQINISAPQFYVDSPEFQEQVLPLFKQLEGRPITDLEFQSIVNSDFLKQVQQQADDVRARYDSLQWYKSNYNFTDKATDRDAWIAALNSAMGQTSSNDDQSQIIFSINEDGTFRTKSVKQALEDFNSNSDRQKARHLKLSNEIIENPNTSDTERAIQIGLRNFFIQQGALKGKLGTNVEAFLNRFTSNLGESFIGKVADTIITAPTDLLSGRDVSIAAQAREAADLTAGLEGGQGFQAAGGVLGSIAGIGADIAASIPIGGAAAGAAGAGLSRVPGGARAIDAGTRALEALHKVPKVGSIASTTIRGIPQDVTFGTEQAIAGNEYSGRDFVTDIAMNAAGLSAFKAAGKAGLAVDTATSGKLFKASEEVGRAATRGYLAVRNLPGIKKIADKVSTNYIDSAAAIRRQLRDDWAHKRITTAEYYEGYNAVRWLSLKGKTEATEAIAASPVFQNEFRIRQSLSKEQLEQAAEYINARQILQRIEGGRYEMSAKRAEELTEALGGMVARMETPELRAAYDSIARVNEEITNHMISFGLADEDIITALRNDEAFRDGYVALQKQLDPEIDRFAQTVKDKSLNNTEVIRRLVGPSSLDELDAPWNVAIDKMYAIHAINAKNRVHRMIVDGIKKGNVAGTVTKEANVVRARNTLRNILKEEREVVVASLDEQVSKLEKNLNAWVEDVEDFTGRGQIIIEGKVDEAVDELTAELLKNKKLQPEITRLMDELGAGKAGAENIASLGILDRNKEHIIKRLEDSLANTELGAEGRREVVNMFERSITTRLDDALLANERNRDPLLETVKEIRRLNNELVPSDKQMKPQAYYENGAKGEYQVADPVMQDFMDATTPEIEKGIFHKLLQSTSRLFRTTTTGLDPTFALGVNPTRDTVRATITAGGEFLNPKASMRTILEAYNLPKSEITALERELDAFINSSNLLTASTFRGERPTVEMATRALEEATGGKLKKVQVALDLRNPGRSIDKIEDAMSIAETAVRKRAYNARFSAAIKRGQDVAAAHQEGLFYAANATADFLNVGSQVRRFAQTVPYLTAAINGSASFARLVMLDPIGIAARFGVGVTLPVMWLTARNLSDPERAAAYATIPDYERENNFILVMDDGSIIEIPLDQEIAKFINPIRRQVEAFHGLEPETFAETFGRFVLGAGPIDLSGVVERDVTGGYDFAGGLARAASGLIPQALRPVTEFIGGRDLYTGQPITMSDEELYERGLVQAGDDVDPEDRTRAGADSQFLRSISRHTNIDQFVYQNIVKNYTGNVGRYALNFIDRLAGAPEDKQGGRPIMDALANRYFSQDFDEADQKFRQGLDKLEGEKKKLLAQLQRTSKDDYFGDEEAIAKRQEAIDKFGQMVGEFAAEYGQMYERTGGLKPYYIDRLVKLLNLSEGGGAFESGDYRAGLEGQVATEATYDAKRRASELGIPTSNERDRYGRLYSDIAGNILENFDKTSFASSNIKQITFGTPKQVAFEFDQLMKADKDTGRRSMYDEARPYRDEIDKLYKQASGLKGKAAAAVYEQISAVQERYMTEVFDQRIRPLIDKYGPEVLLNNKKIFEEIGSYIMVPGDFTPFASRKKQPYQKDDVESYLKDRYGVGKINQSNLPTDDEAVFIMNQINSDLDSGRTGSAQYKLNRLRGMIESGQLYVNPAAMEEIKRMLAIANRR